MLGSILCCPLDELLESHEIMFLCCLRYWFPIFAHPIADYLFIALYVRSGKLVKINADVSLATCTIIHTLLLAVAAVLSYPASSNVSKYSNIIFYCFRTFRTSLIN